MANSVTKSRLHLIPLVIAVTLLAGLVLGVYVLGKNTENRSHADEGSCQMQCTNTIVTLFQNENFFPKNTDEVTSLMKLPIMTDCFNACKTTPNFSQKLADSKLTTLAACLENYMANDHTGTRDTINNVEDSIKCITPEATPVAPSAEKEKKTKPQTTTTNTKPATNTATGQSKTKDTSTTGGRTGIDTVNTSVNTGGSGYMGSKVQPR